MINDIEKRKAYKALWDERQALDDSKWKIEKPIWDAMQEATEHLFAEYQAKKAAVEKPFKEQIEAATKETEDRIDALNKQMDGLGLGDHMHNEDYSHAFFCAVSRLPIFTHDKVIEDAETGEMILRDAVKPAAIA